MTHPTVVSAPGKVLFAGGYLVLDRQYTGLVIATSSRFYCVVSPTSTSVTAGSSARITVRAGQFPRDASTWSYVVSASPRGVVVQPEVSEGRNKFVEITLSNALRVVAEYSAKEGEEDLAAASAALVDTINKQGGLDIVVLANNDFYSQREQLSALSLPPLYSSLDALQPFAPLPRPIHKTNKTGLGSSAALVTSLTAGILAHFQIVSIPSPSPSDTPRDPSTSPRADIELVHNLSQFSHCLAQGKVGSGFDISSAVFGTHIYRRFSPSVLAPLMGSEAPIRILPQLRSSAWDHTTLPFALPRGLRLMLADVDAGTDTPSFVGKVLKWRAESVDKAKSLWDSLGAANERLGQLLRNLAGMQGEEAYPEVLSSASTREIEQVCRTIPCLPPSLLPTHTLHPDPSTIRSHLQQMSARSDVPIEPAEQTRLLDTCSRLPGVLGGTVPGAGGYDAIVLLVIDAPHVVAAVERTWAEWREMSVCPLSAMQSDGGIQLERLEGVKGLKERLSE
ncbi:ribosomal protein S5 domain 2-type protein [Papiliotrema laurentii]|uniref:Phosphomevalonate kinase n=1 Tax=Papiliotrema laurentii TaxID=5418 RepID=A0AAD9CX83_PAPLA|nr:ribosomal protein S5 domain 2-type protein [Papiliotrema laurentii]